MPNKLMCTACTEIIEVDGNEYSYLDCPECNGKLIYLPKDKNDEIYVIYIVVCNKRINQHELYERGMELKYDINNKSPVFPLHLVVKKPLKWRTVLELASKVHKEIFSY